MLSRDCDGCERQIFECKRRFAHVCLGEKVFCPDGTAHLVDSKQSRSKRKVISPKAFPYFLYIVNQQNLVRQLCSQLKCVLHGEYSMVVFR